MAKGKINDVVRNGHWKINKEEVIEALEQAASRHKKGVYRFPLHTIYLQDEEIRIVPRDFSNNEIILSLNALISMRFTLSEGDGAPETLTFKMFYGSLTITLKGYRREDRFDYGL